MSRGNGTWADLGRLMRGLLPAPRIFSTERTERRAPRIPNRRQSEMFADVEEPCVNRCGECLYWQHEGSDVAEGFCPIRGEDTAAGDGSDCTYFRPYARHD